MRRLGASVFMHTRLPKQTLSVVSDGSLVFLFIWYYWI
ncbi:hypothetical protein ASZ90_017890 [hydrocarbon metagenome]|uniref:Uncharacterized protein n=1 Tax=hydrocarbon metagenome TaxID=938273 RepID=A0A0W8E7Y9_9ZZZZ